MQASGLDVIHLANVMVTGTSFGADWQGSVARLCPLGAM